MKARAWHLPGYGSDSGRSMSGVIKLSPRAGPDDPVLEAPHLSDREAAGVAATVKAAAALARAERSHEEVVRRVSRAALRIADPEDPIGQDARQLLRQWLGWSEQVIRESLAGMAREWTEDALHELVISELGDPALLSGFVRDRSAPGRRRKAIGPPLIFQVHAGNVPGVPVSSVILSLVARSGVLAKSGSDEPWLLPLFAQALADEDDLLGDCLAVTWWPGDSDPPVFTRWAKESSKALIYGGDEAVRAVRDHLSPDTELIVYGPRTGVAVFLPDAPAGGARLLVRDALSYEQRGCVSPRLVYIVGSDPLNAARRIATELQLESDRLGPPQITDEDAVALRDARAAAEFEGMADGSTLALGPTDLAWTVLARTGPGISSQTLPRTLYTYGVPDLAALGDVLRPLARRVQVLGYAGRLGEERLAALAAELGVGRVCALGAMAWPPMDWRQEGRPRLLPLLDWTDWEDGA